MRMPAMVGLSPPLLARVLGGLLGLFSVWPDNAAAQEMEVQPYVQDRSPTSAWILWETTTGDDGSVEWGTTESLGTTTSVGNTITTEGSHRVHEVHLEPLSPSTRYYYRARTGTATSATYHFTTPALPSSETSFRMIAVSDMQHDRANMAVWGNVIHQGILGFLAADGPLPDASLSFVLVPGDLVDDGREHMEWVSEFFAPAADLMSFVPFYPVLGNHEQNADLYYHYFRLPESPGGTADRTWAFDHGNVRVIGLDSNVFLFAGPQETFLEGQLSSACTDDAIDFVFVEVHHPHHSELWPPGEAVFTTQVVERVDRFTNECGRPAVLFYGHTHAYSRGASRDAAHLWINVATAGGNIDYFGEYDDQYDDPEVQVSQDEWGFVVLDVEAGPDPSLRLRRFSLGNETTARTRELRDEMTVRRYDVPPAAPTAASPVGRVRAECALAAASPFSDPDGDAHFAAHWQVSTSCSGFADPLLEVYRTRENQYGGVDRAAGDDLEDELLSGLSAGVFYCWRVRYRDSGLAWSEWSLPVAFRIDEMGAGRAMGCTDPTPLEPPPADAGVDAATVPVPAGSCACRAHPRGPLPSVWLAPLTFALIVCGRRLRTCPRRSRGHHRPTARC